MKLKKKLSLTCALALGTVVSVTTVGITTVSCSGGDSSSNNSSGNGGPTAPGNGGSASNVPSYVNENYKPAASIENKFTRGNFTQIVNNITSLEKQYESSFSEDFLNPQVNLQVNLTGEHFVETITVTGEEKQTHARINTPTTIVNKLDINLIPDASSQFAVEITVLSNGVQVSSQSTLWSLQEVQRELQMLWQNPGSSNNDESNNQANPEFKPEEGNTEGNSGSTGNQENTGGSIGNSGEAPEYSKNDQSVLNYILKNNGPTIQSYGVTYWIEKYTSKSSYLVVRARSVNDSRVDKLAIDPIIINGKSYPVYIDEIAHGALSYGELYPDPAVNKNGFSISENLSIPDSVYCIGKSAFENTYLTSITIPDSVKTIGEQAFRNCRSLTSITIPNSITTIENWVFGGCSKITSITIPDSVKTIKAGAFSGTRITSVNIPNSVTYLNGFSDCERLTSITIPNSVTTIGAAAFKNSGLTSITIPNQVTTIEEYAFNGARKLMSIKFSPNSSLTSIGSNAFEETLNDAGWEVSLKIPESVTTIGAAAFGHCTKLGSINIPDSVTTIQGSTFYNCEYLHSVQISSNSSLSEIKGSAFYGCDKLTSINIPNSITTINSYTFYGCKNLRSINIPDSVTTIGENAFSNCWALKSITIPNSVTTIGNQAFSSCYILSTIIFPNNKITFGDNIVNNTKVQTVKINKQSVYSEKTFYNKNGNISVTFY